jgi:hypothetical protein
VDETKSGEKAETDKFELTFDSGRVLKVGGIDDKEFAMEIVCQLKLEFEHRLRAYLV